MSDKEREQLPELGSNRKMKKSVGKRAAGKKSAGRRPGSWANYSGPDDEPRDDHGRWTRGGSGGSGMSPRELGSAPTIRGGFKFGAGERVRIRGGPQSPMATRHAGKVGRVSTVSPSGDYYGVVDSKGKHLGYFHQSDLASV